MPSSREYHGLGGWILALVCIWTEQTRLQDGSPRAGHVAIRRFHVIADGQLVSEVR